MIDALMIYPILGSMDAMVVDLPLSVLYASAESVKRGYNIKVLDLRTVKTGWKQALDACFEEGVMLAGISVMTGKPLENAREVSQYIKAKYPQTMIVWGGPHVTVLPETIEEPFIDFLVRGYGSISTADLIDNLKNGSRNLSDIQGLSYYDDEGQIVQTPRSTSHEGIRFDEIPYDLVDVNSSHYLHTYNQKRMFPIFSAIGCPYRCSFCVHPRIYREINGAKWVAYPDDEIINHILHVQKKYGANHIVFMDDTSFPDIRRMEHLFHMIIEKNINITMEFRGARINEIDRMSDEFLDLMVEAGGRVVMVGVESGSPHILKEFQKGITKEQILRANQKLARHPEISPHYNFIYGAPGETYEDLLETKEVALQLLDENPNAFFGFGGDWKPIPGTKLLEKAMEDYPNFIVPKTLDEWIEMDSSDAGKKIYHPWYTRRQNNLIMLLQLSSFVIDDKIIRESEGNNTPLFIILRMMARIYKPIAMFRLRFNVHQFMFEYKLWQLSIKMLSKLS